MSELPKGWADATLGEITVLRGEKLDPATVPDAPFVGLEDIEPHTSRILKTGQGSDVKSAVARFSAGDVLYSRLRPYLNKVTVPDFDGVASAEILVLQPTAATEAEFVHRRIMTREFLDFAALLDKGDRPRVTFKEIAEFPVALPPLPEQRRIVAKVDGLTARTARARKELDRIPTLIARYKQRLLALAFSGELTAEWRKKTGLKSELASGANSLWEAPSVWIWQRVDEVGKVGLGRQRSPKNHKGPDMRPYMRSANITWNGIDTSDVKEMNFDDKDFERFQLKYGDVLLNEGSGSAKEVGKPAIWRDEIPECCYQNTILRVQPEKCSSEYLYWYFLLTALSERFVNSTKGMNIQHISKDGLARYLVPVPSPEEQAEIVRLIESAYRWLDRMAADHTAADRLLPKLDAAILAKAFRGELVPQDPNDEPASALLARIKAEREAVPKEKRGRGRRAKLPPITATASGEVVITGSATATVGPRKAGKVAMTKSRQDDDVKHKPYLAGLLKSGRFSDAQSLFRAADLPVADFYKQLAWEIDKGHILDNAEELKAA